MNTEIYYCDFVLIRTTIIHIIIYIDVYFLILYHEYIIITSYRLLKYKKLSILINYYKHIRFQVN